MANPYVIPAPTARKVDAPAVAKALTHVEDSIDALEGHGRHMKPDDASHLAEARLLLRQAHSHLNALFLSQLAQAAIISGPSKPGTEA